jgi:hypothetical protein
MKTIDEDNLHALRATPPLHCTKILDEEKSKQASLAQQHGFGQHFCTGF